MAHAVAMMTDIAGNRDKLYDFVPADLRAQARISADKALDCILAARIVTDGRRTVWGQQHDPIALRPVPARKFEPALPSAAESADLLLFLMSRPDPSPALVTAVDDGVRWLKDTAITGHEWTKDRRLTAKPGAGPIWARFYDPETSKPRFGDRDMSITDDVNDLSPERRAGYAWYGTWPLKTLKRYVAWAKEHAAP
jgi:PelA/Pel-15E family pectate lyase